MKEIDRWQYNGTTNCSEISKRLMQKFKKIHVKYIIIHTCVNGHQIYPNRLSSRLFSLKHLETHDVGYGSIPSWRNPLCK